MDVSENQNRRGLLYTWLVKANEHHKEIEKCLEEARKYTLPEEQILSWSKELSMNWKFKMTTQVHESWNHGFYAGMLAVGIPILLVQLADRFLH